MTKKTIILVLIFLIVINTIFWLNLTIKTFAGSEDYLKREYEKKGIIGGGKTDWSEYKTKTEEEREEQRKRLEEARAIENTITYRLIRIFEGKETMLITFLILTDAVLIAIYFMMIPLYKKDKTLRGRKNEKDI